MRILALETSGRLGSVAALDDNNLLAQMELNPSTRSAASLAPAVREILARVSWPPASVELVAVTVGPGSFTGLRIGVTTAKLFAYAVEADLVGVNTLNAIARQALAETNRSRLAAAIDAGRGQVFARRFERQAGEDWKPMGETAIESVEDWLRQLTSEDAVSGPAIDALADRIPSSVQVVEAAHRQPMAATVGQLARERHAAGQRDDVWKLAPLYLRRSAAEEKREGSAG
ncbi:MAG TPA: tRNA (adenosine(37)-N6)-threonylcarbamoyltransferase complex dimerization subunit type 1 TsaB [Pirellulales bacterium]|nr:tRNA (adenosine(37)-N6)-threonylcarbamoyltransferase complex dimerization subunit type 1 TsaB [Pirellulales bacterium]